MSCSRFARSCLSFAAAAGVLSCADRSATAPAGTGAESITAATMRRQVAAIAADSTRGRVTPSVQLDRVAAWAVAQFRADGLEPGDTAGYLQTWSAPGGSAPNAVAVLPGRDSVLAGEYVLFVAHMDHLGTVSTGAGCRLGGDLADSVCNGADDNASGTAAVLELAHAYGSLATRPRRSLVFLLVSGEEEGLLGSLHYVAHPAVPLAQTVAAVNLDMISRNAPDSLLVIGMAESSLGTLLGAVMAAHPELGLRPTGVPWPYGGSDHIPFGNAGVPTVFFFAGLHDDYHRPSDEAGSIDADKAARVARLAFYLGLAVADGDARPAWTAAPARASTRTAPL